MPNARSLLLDLLRVVPGRAAVPVQGLVRIAEIFGITGNALRVALSRLVEAELLESDGRGQYRLSKASDPVSNFVEDWRLGEKRMRRWEGGWLCVLLPRPSPGRKERAASVRALGFLNLREAGDSLWARPDNLAGGIAAARAQLRALGLEEGALVFSGSEFDGDTTAQWAATLWQDEMSSEEAALARKLHESMAALPGIPQERAFVETFVLGGRAIKLIARDPLLPEEIRDGGARRALTDAMLAYDVAGRRAWAGVLSSALALRGAPAQVSGI